MGPLSVRLSVCLSVTLQYCRNGCTTQMSYIFTTTVHKLSFALSSSSPITTEVLQCYTRALYHISGMKYFNLSLQLTSCCSGFLAGNGVTELR